MLLVSIVVFIGLLLALVLVHEWGHFIVARLAGCRIEEFAFGFPPRLLAFTKNGTRYAFNLLPLGGYVKIEGEDMENPLGGPTSFASKSAPWRVAILAAGVVMNVVLAALFLIIQAGLGVPVLVTDENSAQVSDQQTFIVNVDPGSPAALAGIKALDRLVRINDLTLPSVAQVQSLAQTYTNQVLVLEVERQGQHLTVKIVPRLHPPTGQGAMGVALQATGLEKTAWWKAPGVGLTRTWQMLKAIVEQFFSLARQLLSQGSVGESLTGPVGIALYAHEVTQLGASYVLEFGALISLNLAIINILPFPALDGGRILFVLLSSLLGRRLPLKIEQYAHLTGFALLILLMVLITFKDVQHLF